VLISSEVEEIICDLESNIWMQCPFL